MNRSIILVFWLVALLVLLVSQPVAAQSPPAPAKTALPTSLARDTVQLSRLADCMSALDSFVNSFDDKVDSLFHKGLDFKVFRAHCEKAETQMARIQKELDAIQNQCTGNLSKLVRPQVRGCVETLRRYRGANQALIGGESNPSGFKYSQYARATSNLLQSMSNCLQAVQQARAEQQVKAHVTKGISDASKQARLRSDSLRSLAVLLHRLDSVRFDTLTNIGRRIEAILRPYPLPHTMILAGTYQENAYSLGVLHYNTKGSWAAAGGIRYDATARRVGGEVAFGYRAQAFVLLAGPTLQVAPAQLGWKVQAVLLKRGPSLGIAYDSNLGPGILVAFGMRH